MVLILALQLKNLKCYFRKSFFSVSNFCGPFQPKNETFGQNGICHSIGHKKLSQEHITAQNRPVKPTTVNAQVLEKISLKITSGWAIQRVHYIISQYGPLFGKLNGQKSCFQNVFLYKKSPTIIIYLGGAQNLTCRYRTTSWLFRIIRKIFLYFIRKKDNNLQSFTAFPFLDS